MRQIGQTIPEAWSAQKHSYTKKVKKAAAKLNLPPKWMRSQVYSFPFALGTNITSCFSNSNANANILHHCESTHQQIAHLSYRSIPIDGHILRRAILVRMILWISFRKKNGVGWRVVWIELWHHFTNATSLIELTTPAVEPFQLWRRCRHQFSLRTSSAKGTSPSLFLMNHLSYCESTQLEWMLALVSDLPRGSAGTQGSSVVTPLASISPNPTTTIGKDLYIYFGNSFRHNLWDASL